MIICAIVKGHAEKVDGFAEELPVLKDIFRTHLSFSLWPLYFSTSESLLTFCICVCVSVCVCVCVCVCMITTACASLWTKAGTTQISCVLQEGKVLFSSDAAYENTAEGRLKNKVELC